MTAAEKLARRFHDLYEQMAPGFGYTTREETRQFIPESPNGKLMIAVCEALAASPEVQALIREAEARGMNNGMLTAIEVVADERNKRNPGPLFEVLNKAIGKIEDARFAALRAAKDAP